MDYKNGRIANSVIPIDDFLIGNETASPVAASNSISHRRVDFPHGIPKLSHERLSSSPDEVRALLVELRSLLSKLNVQQAELELQNEDLRRNIAQLERVRGRDVNLLELTGQLASVGGWELNLTTSELYWTKETCRIHELDGFQTPSLEEAINFYSPESRHLLRAALETAIAEGTSWDLELSMVTAKGNSIWVRAQGTVILENGEPITLHGAVQAVTDRRRAEDARVALEVHLRNVQKLEAVGTLAGGVAHDFNNILAAIIGNTDVAMLSIDSPDVTMRCLREISNASDRGRELVKQILSFGSPRTTERKRISITPVVEESIQLLRAIIPARVALKSSYSDNLPSVLVDATQFTQVIVNLATNAFQAMAGRPGNIEVKIDSIRMDARLRELMPQTQSEPGEVDQILRVVVSDDGPGMTDSTLSRLFEPFFTTKPVGEGTGLGLAVVHGIIRNHHGAITVDSKLGEGATFTIYLPASTKSEKSLDLPTEEYDATIAPQHDCKRDVRVLFVDDDPAVLRSTTSLLEHQGFHVSGFSDQIAAMDALRGAAMPFDIVVADYNMPCVSGIEFARFVRAQHPNLPIVVISGLIDDSLRTEASRAGVQELIAKPFSLKSFCDKLHQVIARSAMIKP